MTGAGVGFALVYGLLAGLQPGSEGVVLQHSLSPDHVRTEIDAHCAEHRLRIEFGNAEGRRGDVTFVTLDDRNVVGAASALRARAAGRYIERIDIMNCGFDAEDPVIAGVMELSAMASRHEGLPPRVHFRLRREGGAWRIVLE